MIPLIVIDRDVGLPIRLLIFCFNVPHDIARLPSWYPVGTGGHGGCVGDRFDRAARLLQRCGDIDFAVNRFILVINAANHR